MQLVYAGSMCRGRSKAIGEVCSAPAISMRTLLLVCLPLSFIPITRSIGSSSFPLTLAEAPPALILISTHILSHPMAIPLIRLRAQHTFSESDTAIVERRALEQLHTFHMPSYVSPFV